MFIPLLKLITVPLKELFTVNSLFGLFILILLKRTVGRKIGCFLLGFWYSKSKLFVWYI